MTPSGVTALRMKPNFALSLSFDGIRLLHRAGASGWHLVGEVALECEDLSADLAALREKAAALDASGLSCKLIIPDDQIRYLDLPAKSAPYGDYDAAAAEALDGATPYALEELAFDCNVEGARLYVAAVARETLQEAENFAADHGFNPVSFVARPEEDGFGTEPFFGETTTATGPVERDAERIEIIGAARLPEPAEVPEPVEEAAPAPAPAPEQATPPEPEREPAPEAEPAPKAEAAGADSAPDPEGEPEGESAVAFTSIRAERDAPATGAPTLAGVARSAPDMVGSGPDEAQTTPGPAAASLAPSPDSERADTASGDGATIGFFSRRARRAEPVAPPPVPRAEPGFFGIEDDAPASPVGHATGPGLSLPEDEAERMTIFGARSAQRGRPGKPRFLGLILTAALLLLMVGVAAWAAIFPESGVGRILRGAEPEIAITPEIPEIAAPASVPEVPDLVVEDPVPEVAPPVVTPEPEPEIVRAPEPRTEADIPEPPAGPLTPEEARARYVVTGIWQTPPAPPQEPEAGTIDDFYLTSIDEDVPVGDAVALPAVPGLAADARRAWRAHPDRAIGPAATPAPRIHRTGHRRDVRSRRRGRRRRRGGGGGRARTEHHAAGCGGLAQAAPAARQFRADRATGPATTRRRRDRGPAHSKLCLGRAQRHRPQRDQHAAGQSDRRLRQPVKPPRAGAAVERALSKGAGWRQNGRRAGLGHRRQRIALQ